MAKRANPFTEDFMPQSKVHVGLKQFNNNDDRLKQVYEKTLKLLYKGAKNIPTIDTINNNYLHNAKKDEKLKQLCIGKDGSLLYTSCVMKPQKNSKQCSCASPMECQCAYCETALCGTCQHSCQRCERNYCSHCTLVGCEGAEVCVSCYS